VVKYAQSFSRAAVASARWGLSSENKEASDAGWTFREREVSRAVQI
jgi:hypothetical protein